MRIFKWSPAFNPKHESTIVPIWVGLPDLPAHLLKKAALDNIETECGSSEMARHIPQKQGASASPNVNTLPQPGIEEESSSSLSDSLNASEGLENITQAIDILQKEGCRGFLKVSSLFNTTQQEIESLVQKIIFQMSLMQGTTKGTNPLMSILATTTGGKKKNKHSSQRVLWEELVAIAEEGVPWLVRGDFNTFLHAEENIGGSFNRTDHMEDFGDMIMDIGLIDAGFKGEPFTWTNNRIWRRLDRDHWHGQVLSLALESLT
ncbi:UNVERIFIED_CONTAM: hypothetical protein Sradi_3882000 [Sesamum radiatum]|uniref:DUF4283 domain-containing protein n=1 Tax=Sesamum radiatum TaxID=300843 RepID=A0AAW2Q2N8_SESRA